MVLENLNCDDLFQKSKSVHKVYQFMRFLDAENNPLEGQISRIEDANLCPYGTPGFDKSTSRTVIYNFRDGEIHSSDGKPAIQYARHWEYWKNGIIEKVCADGGKAVEIWENGTPLCIKETADFGVEAYE